MKIFKNQGRNDQTRTKYMSNLSGFNYNGPKRYSIMISETQNHFYKPPLIITLAKIQMFDRLSWQGYEKSHILCCITGKSAKWHNLHSFIVT